MLTLQQQISNACNLFTQQVLHLIGSASLETLCAALPSPSKIALPKQTAVVSSRRAQLVEMNKVAVACPVPGCEERGARSKNNFCAEHARDLPADVKEQLREAQRTAKSPPAQDG